jgi:3-hydroxyisobutyrate dehydrogenase
MAMIGFAGLGHMGTPMAGRLAAAGHRLRVYDSAPAARAGHGGLDGVVVLSPLAQIADGADVVILMLPDSAVVAQVLLADGLLEHVASSAVVVDMSSSVPARTRELACAAAERGVTLIDAPVSGGVAGAQSGSLTIMAGGPVDVLDRLRPVLEVLGSHVVHAGDIAGAGHAIKALNNLMSAAHLLASSEALLAGRQFGLDPDVMLSIVNSSSGRSGSTQVKWPTFILPEAYDSGFGLRLMLKDMRIALQLEQEAGVPAPLGQAPVAAWAAAAEDLPPAADHPEIDRRRAARPPRRARGGSRSEVVAGRSGPVIFCAVVGGGRSRSAWLEVGGIVVSVRNRSTSASRWRPGRCHHLAGPLAQSGRRLPARRLLPAGAGAVPRPGRPAERGRGYERPERGTAGDRGLPGRRGQRPASAGAVPRPRRPVPPDWCPGQPR